MTSFTTANAHYVDTRLAVGGDLDEVSRDLARAQLAELVGHGVTHILDLRIEYSDEALVADLAPAITYHHLGVDDAGQAMPAAWFDAGVGWLDAALADPDAKVLVHCHMGVNRAPSMVFAYLLHQGHGVREALDAIRQARSIAVIDYADDALDWHHQRSGAAPGQAATDMAALTAWRADNGIDVEAVIRGIRGDEERRAVCEDLASAFAKISADQDGYRTWLFQMSKDYADGARRDYVSGEESWLMPIGRYTDEVEPGDLVLLWQMGPKDTAGLFGCGVVAEVGLEATRPVEWEDPDGSERTSPAIETEFLTVISGLLVTRPEMKETPEFCDGSFDLFRMAQRPNLFPVEPKHLHRLSDLLARKAARS